MDDLPNQLGAQCSNTQSNWEIERKKERKKKVGGGGFLCITTGRWAQNLKVLHRGGGGKGVTNSELYYVIY